MYLAKCKCVEHASVPTPQSISRACAVPPTVLCSCSGACMLAISDNFGFSWYYNKLRTCAHSQASTHQSFTVQVFLPSVTSSTVVGREPTAASTLPWPSLRRSTHFSTVLMDTARTMPLFFIGRCSGSPEEFEDSRSRLR